MISLIFLLIGGIVGLYARYYCRHFAESVAVEIYYCYCEIFPENPPSYQWENAAIKAIKCGSNLGCFVIFSGIFLACSIGFDNPYFALIIALKCSLLAVISLIDFHYKLISTALCQQLMMLGIVAAYFELANLNLEQALFSGFIAFSLFWLIYHLAKCAYQTEAFGRGDYWLIGGLATFHSWETLPLLIFIACVSALIYALWLKLHKRPVNTIPFAPFLCFGGLSVFGLNLAALI